MRDQKARFKAAMSRKGATMPQENPYTLGEAKMAATHNGMNPYHRELILWLIGQIELAPVWTTTPPTEPGWYWRKSKDVGTSLCRLDEDLAVWWEGVDKDCAASVVGGEWQGPIKPQG